MDISGEPTIGVGLISGALSAKVTLSGSFSYGEGGKVSSGDLTIFPSEGGGVSVRGAIELDARQVVVKPENFQECRFTLHDVTIGIGFHWERKEAQVFQGSLLITSGERGLNIINEVPLESYLVSVISSEMSAANHAELLKAHAIVARSWLLAQLLGSDPAKLDRMEQPTRIKQGSTIEIVRWYDRESHSEFDVCADDHCQRYQGISKAFSASASEAVEATRGAVLGFAGEICDARYSKCCGGLTEVYSSAWAAKDLPYLASVYDGPGELTGYDLPLAKEKEAARWITSLPRAYCCGPSPELLERILPDFDLETRDYYRWVVSYQADELREIVRSRLGEDPGSILALEPMARGPSGRLIRLRIAGQKCTLIIGKELEIRKVLSRSHLYSSAFVVRHEENPHTGYPERFILKGAGWGHGVGLCQIGAAVMAELGHASDEILAHYFRGATVRKVYG